MPLHYLFGPVTGHFAEQNLHSQRRSGLCLAFGVDDGADLTIQATDSWDDVCTRFPDGWRPDLLVLNLAYGVVPGCIWRTTLPKIGLAIDWRLLWHYYRGRLGRCDLVLSDSLGAAVMGCEGIAARRANLCGCDRAFVNPEGPHDERVVPLPLRDIDVLFVGNLNPAVQRERAPWLMRLAELGRRWRVQVRTGVFGEEYRRLLKRARIAFQFSGHGKLGRRAFEAASSGALVFQETGNRELPAFFRDGKECVYYRDDNFAELIGYYLQHEEERAALAEAARKRAQSCRFEDLWQEEMAAVENDWPALRDRAGRPDLTHWRQELSTRAWQALVSGPFEDMALLGELERASRNDAEVAPLANLLGCMLWRQGRGRTPSHVLGQVASEQFRRACTAQPDFVVAGMNLAESLDAAGQRSEAIGVARRTLELLHRQIELDAASVEAMPLCQVFEPFHVEWERAAWKSGGKPKAEAEAKRNLIFAKLHGLLASWTGELPHFYEAALVCPELPSARALLGNALLRAGKPHESLGHLRAALTHNPLDRDAAHALFDVLGTVQDIDGRRRLCEDSRLLHQAVPHVLPSESWFAGPRPKGNELASIILLCPNRADHTRQCVERVLTHTRRPFELVLLVNGSNAAAVEYAEAIQQGAEPARVEVIRRPAHLGIAAAYNEALGRMRGHYIVFLDGATMVTPGWVDSLIGLALHDWPRPGLVGPTTNGVSAPQGIPVDLQRVEELNRFAAERRRAWSGQMSPVQGLASLCLLTRRETLEQLGRFDEGFVLGRYAVYDLCLRAREAGLRLLLAQDVFVFQAHDGSMAESAHNDVDLFRDKWGCEPTAENHEPPPSEAEPSQAEPTRDTETPTADRRGVSLCMIVKNEEANLPECLRTVQGLFDEIVVVDTGSSDATREAARRFGAKVFEFPWVDTFAAARNESIRHATGKWIMWLDADDRLDDDNRERLRQVFAGLGDELDVYAITVRSVLDADRTSFRLLDQVRIFRNLPQIRWDYRIHEQILPAVNRVGGVVRWTDVVVDHIGYQDASLRHRKLERNLRLLEMDYQERPDDSFSLFNLGWTLLDLNRTHDALPRLQRSLETAKPDSSILRKLYHLLAIAQRQLGSLEEAMRFCREGLQRFPDDAELLLEQGLMQRDRGNLLGAAISWSRLFEPKRGKYFSSEDVGLRGFRTRHLLAEVFAKEERWSEAEVQWRAAFEERADFEPAWMGLAELFLRSGRYGELEELLQTLEDGGAASPKVRWLKARGLVQRKEYALAHKLLGEVIAQDPQAIGPRVLLSQALLQEGRDWPAAEKALLDVLHLDPDNKDAKHNLHLLQRRHGRRGPNPG